MRDFFRPARRVGGGSGTKFSLHAKSGPKSAFWGSLGEFCTGWACQGRLLGEFCTGWAAEPGGWASFVSLRARCGLHRAFLTPIGAPPIDAAVMRCRYTCARWSCPTGQWEPHPGSVRCAFIAPRKPPAHASCVGGRQRKHQQASARNASVPTEPSSATVACSLLLERHSVDVGFAQLEAGALVEAVRSLA